MLENLFTNVFGRPKNKSSSGRVSQSDSSSGSTAPGQQPSSSQMTGPFSMSNQMPQPPNLPYPIAPYPSANSQHPSSYYPPLPFSQPPSLPSGYTPHGQPSQYPTATLATSRGELSPLDSVPFEAKLTLNNSTNLVSLDHLFKEIKKAADVVDRTDAYLRSRESDYDFKTERGVMYQ